MSNSSTSLALLTVGRVWVEGQVAEMAVMVTREGKRGSTAFRSSSDTTRYMGSRARHLSKRNSLAGRQRATLFRGFSLTSPPRES